MAPETYKGKFIAALWDIFLTIGRWVELAGDDGWALPTADNLRNNILTRWAWEDGSAPDNVKPWRLTWWLGQKAGSRPIGLATSSSHTLTAMSVTCTLVTRLRRRITSPTPNRLARPFWSPWGHPATPPQLLSIARLPPQHQVASLPDYPTCRHQSTPDSLSMTPPWTPNTRQHHWCHLRPHPLQWMWTRLLPRLVVET